METLQVPEQSLTTSNFYHWEVPGKNTSVQLDFGVVDRLLVEVMRGFGAIPRRGAEVGGILLGTVEPGEKTVIRIEEFEPIACEHRHGPSYVLSDADTARFAETALRHRKSGDKRVYAVGCYRSHTREGMALGAEDLGLFSEHFPGAESVFLLVKPFATRVSIAGFFFREPDGSIHADAPYQEFPFRRRELGGGASPAVRMREPGHPGPIPTTARPFPAGAAYAPGESTSPDYHAEENPVAYDEAGYAPYIPDAPLEQESAELRRFRRSNLFLPLSFLFLLAGIFLGWWASNTFRPLSATSHIRDPFKLAIEVNRDRESLHVRWDRSSAAVRGAYRGVLHIEDGEYKSAVNLDIMQLQNPNVYYKHITAQVGFRLEIFVNDHVSVVESFEWRK